MTGMYQELKDNIPVFQRFIQMGENEAGRTALVFGFVTVLR